MKKNNFTSSSPQTKGDDDNKVEKKKNACMRDLLHDDTETSENFTTKTRTRERGWIDDKTPTATASVWRNSKNTRANNAWQWHPKTTPKDDAK